jgi:ParB/RepB/Spo0J family partition protein
MIPDVSKAVDQLIDRQNGTFPIVGEIPINEVKIGDRFRQDLGDIAELADSIRKVGLIQPIVINGSNELIAGARRLEAFKHLGRTSIPFRVIDVPSMLLAEHDENQVRKDFTLTERDAIADALEKEIKSQQGKRNDLDPEFAKDLKRASAEERAKVTSGRRPQSSRRSERVAKAAGFTSRRQRTRVKNVAANGITALVEKMDAGEIDPTTAEKIAKQPIAKQSKMLEEIETKKRRRRTTTDDVFNNNVMGAIAGISLALPQVKIPDLDPEAAKKAIREIKNAEQALRILRRQIEKQQSK